MPHTQPAAPTADSAPPPRLRRLLHADEWAWLARCGLTALACGLMVASAFLFRQMDDPFLAGWAVVVALAGSACLWLAAREVPVTGTALLSERRSRPIRALPVAAGAALFAPLMLVNNDRTAAELALNLSAWVQFGLLAGGVALVAWGLCGAPPLQLRRPDWRVWLPVGAVVGLALALRLWNLENSLRIFVDEIHLSTGASYFWGSHHPRLLQPIGVLMPFPRVFPLWISEAAALFGRDFTGLRFVSAVIGALTVGAAYALGRQIFDRHVALAGALLLATFPPHLHFSRLAIINIADPLFGTLALACLAGGLRTGRRADYALAGVLLGLTQYFYEGGRLLFPALAAVWLLGTTLPAAFRRGTRPPVRASHVGVLVLGAALAALPLVVTVATLAKPLETRLDDAGLGDAFWAEIRASGDLMPFIERLDNPLLVYTRLNDEALYYGGSTPLVLPVFVPLLLLGMAHALRHRDGWLLLAWLLLTSLGNSLLVRSTIYARFVAVLPALALLMGLGVVGTWRLLIPPDGSIGRRGRRAAGVLLAGLVGAVAVVQVGYYFGPHLAELNAALRAGEPPDGHDALLRTGDFRPETGVHLVSGARPFTQEYGEQLGGWVTDGLDINVLTRNELTHAFMLSLSRNVDQAFFIEAGDTASLARIRQYFAVEGPLASSYIAPPEGMLLYRYSAPSSASTLISP